MSPDLVWLAALVGALIIAAGFVNVLAPTQKSRLRRAVVLFVLYAGAYAGAVVFNELKLDAWQDRFAAAQEMLRLLVAVNISGLLVFYVFLPRLRATPPTIAGELIAGIAYFIAIVVVLTRHGLDATGALATGAVASAVLAISLQSTLGNILGGVALQLDGSIHEGDWIQLENGKQGKVRAIRWRHTLIETRDWSTMVVPNAQLLANTITILGYREGRKTPQRMWVYFNVDFRYAPTRVTQVVLDALLAAPIDNVAADPPPSCVCMDFAKDTRDSFAYYAVRYWINDLATDDPTSSRVRGRIYAALKRAGIPLAVPAQLSLMEPHGEAHAKRHTDREVDSALAAVKTVALFNALGADELHTIAEGLVRVPFVTGEVITRQGAVAHYLYILTAGRCEIRAKLDPDGDGPAPAVTRTLATISAPDFFGEMGLMTGAPRSADVVAATDVDCYRLGKATFERVLLARPEIAVELSKILGERRAADRKVREGLTPEVTKADEESEAEKILHGIKNFFGL